MKSLLTLLLFLILFTSILANQSFAQQEDQIPGPPSIPQPTPEPEPIPQPEPEPIKEPFPGLTDEEKFEQLTEENKKLKAEKAQLGSQIDELKIDKGFLQNQINELNKKLNDLNAVVLEQIKVIMSLVTQLKDTVFEKVFSPFNSA
jgi:cell division protein FtsB